MPITKAQLIRMQDNSSINYDGEDMKFLGWSGTKCINHGSIRIGDEIDEETVFVKEFMTKCSISERDDTAHSEVEAALQVLARHANVMGSGGVIGANLAAVLGGSHRTIQQTFIREIKEGIEQYAEENANYTDPRNEAGVQWAKAVAEAGKKIALPYV